MTSARHAARRMLTAGLLAAAVLMPATATMFEPHSRTVAGCAGQGVPLGLNAIGAPFTENCDLVVEPPKAIGAAPSAGAIVACRGIPGCLALWVNNTGNVAVPRVDTRPRSNGH
jgi:hypothetical protein